MRTPTVSIIGGGISGLTTAWWLHKHGISVTVFESDVEAGGTMRTVRTEGWMVETGPNSALETTPLFQTLFDDLGIADEIVYAHPAGKNRYILRNNELHALPMSPSAFITSRLWSLRGKLRLLKEPFVGRADKEESIAEFVERRLGREFLDYAINPFVAGIFAGAPETLSVRAAFPKLYALESKYGGLIRGQIAGFRERKKRGEVAKDRAKMFSFRDGMQTLPNALARQLDRAIRFNTTVTGIQRNAGESSYTLHYRTGGDSEIHRTDIVLFAVPSYSASSLIRPMDSELASVLQEIDYPPVTEVFVGYRKKDIGIPLDGFGFLIPEKERRRILGAIWTSTLFDNRAPEECAALTVFVGGSRQPDMALTDDREMQTLVVDELKDLMRITGPPAFVRITRWEKAIPQYRLGHLRIVEKMERFEESNPGLFLSGNYRDGISVSDCIIQSEKMSKKIQEYCLRFSSLS